MTDDKALELYEQCDRELPDRGDLGSFKRLIGAFARALLATPPSASLAPVAYLNDMGTEQKLSFVPIEGAYEYRALALCDAAPTPSTPAPSQVELDARVELEVKAGLWDEVRIICVPHGAGVDKPITEWLEERLAIHAASTPAPATNTEEALQEIYEGWQDSEDGIWGLIFAVRNHALAIARTKTDAAPPTRPDVANHAGYLRERFLDYWCDDIPENLRSKWRASVNELLDTPNANEKLQAAWDSWKACSAAPAQPTADTPPVEVDGVTYIGRWHENKSSYVVNTQKTLGETELAQLTARIDHIDAQGYVHWKKS